jgi:hypothetical protein
MCIINMISTGLNDLNVNYINSDIFDVNEKLAANVIDILNLMNNNFYDLSENIFDLSENIFDLSENIIDLSQNIIYKIFDLSGNIIDKIFHLSGNINYNINDVFGNYNDLKIKLQIYQVMLLK